MDTETKPDSLRLAKRLEAHPILAARFLRILDIADDTGGDLRRADDAEQRAIEELRVLGGERFCTGARCVAVTNTPAVISNQPAD